MPDEKVFVLDTNVLIQDPSALEKLENDIMIPVSVIQELDKLKNDDIIGLSARSASRQIEAYRATGFLKDGVSKGNDASLFVDSRKIDFGSFAFDLEDTHDNRIVLAALRWQSEHPGKRVVLKSNDLNVRIIASSIGVPAEEYQYERGIPVSDKLYSGTAKIELTEESSFDIFTELYQEGSVPDTVIFSASSATPESLLPNQCCYLMRPDRSVALAIYQKASGLFVAVDKPRERRAGAGIYPINNEQAFAYALLSDQSKSLVTLRGKTGSGKTLMALAAAYAQTDPHGGLYEQILVFRPNIELGQPLGHLPGTLDEKFWPWMQPIIDNFNLVIKRPQQAVAPDKGRGRRGGKKEQERIEEKSKPCTRFDDFREHGFIEISPINFMRGGTLHRRLIIVDEAQNLTPHQIKSMITRAGTGSKVVLTGDTEQIDNRFLNATSNGLSYVIEKFKGQEMFGHITLEKTERSPLAELAAQLL
ncbi:MAG: PhoH family protein [bacterium]|nr:PhoH family protein [bacterium]